MAPIGRRLAIQAASLSAALLVPCLWLSRIQAGDLSSHIYNAWLAQLIERGQAPGLTIAPQSTNVLFDLILSGLLRTVGAGAAQRVAVAACVLVFFWGAFAFLSRVARRRPWFLAPVLAMLAYGWVFNMGFFNFYLSMGLCLWAMALLWQPGWPRAIAAVPLLALAHLAQLLPVGWAAGMLAYGWSARYLRPRHRVWILLAAIGGLFAVRQLLSSHFPVRWYPWRLLLVTGADQFWVFGIQYRSLAMGALLLWAVLSLYLLRQRGLWRVVMSVPFQLCVVNAAAVYILPSAVMLPGYRHSLNYIPDRMSLAVAICAVALLSAVRVVAWHKGAVAALAAIFFVFLYSDHHAANRFEDRLQAVVTQLPPGQRVVSAVADLDSRVNPVAHTLDRICVGRCFSYANYEPCSAAFRVRAAHRNMFVTAACADSYALQTGTYVVKPEDLPLYGIFLSPVAPGLTVRSLQPYETFRVTSAHDAIAMAQANSRNPF